MATAIVTPEQYRAAVEAYEQCGNNNSAAARHLGISPNAMRNRLKRGRDLGYHLSDGARGSMQAAGMNGVEVQGGYKYVLDDEGRKLETVRWSVPKQAIAAEDMLERIRGVFESLTAAPVVSAPEHSEADLLTLYPLSDVHMGLQAWGKETGEDYDTAKAAERVKSWVAQCVASSPASETAVILSAGDLTHADDQTNMTRRSGHILDVDTRHFKTIDITIETLVAAIDCAAEKHAKVRVHIIPGNHDPFAYLAVLFALGERYRDNPRIRVQKTPGEWFVKQHGKVMLAAHHGDKAKADRMVHFIADQYAELWGKTRHRFLFTGHLHHHKSADIGGVQWEQLRAVTARDAYAVSHAYTARAQLQAITFHREKGEVSRVKVNGF
jgi:DNA-binding Lrp family transcriptional regulator